MSSNKEKYRQLCQAEKMIPVFQQDWWLDAACGPGNWDVAIHSIDERIVGSMPFRKSKRLGFTLLNMPLLTSNWGPWIRTTDETKTSTKLHVEHETVSNLLIQLPAFDYFNQRFRYTITNGLPYYWKGFSLQTRYTYVIEDISDLQKVYENFNTNVKRQIRKAEKLVTVMETEDVEQFYRLNVKTFQRQNSEIPYPLSYVKRLDEACKKNNSRKIFLATDEKNHVHASLYMVWDSSSAYYLMGGIDPEFNSGAFSLLMWEAIRAASGVTKRFDFEGSMIESIERFFRSFGSRQVPYLQVQKFNSTLLKLIYSLQKSGN